MEPAKVVRARAPVLTEAVAWWGLLFVVYLWLLSSLSVVELAVGAAVGALCGVLAVLARRAERSTFRFRLRWLRRVPALLADLAGDTVTLVALVVGAHRRSPSQETGFQRLRFPPEPGAHSPRTRRAIATIVLSLTPGTYVVDVGAGEAGDDELLVHQLGRRGRLMKEMGR